MEWENKQIQKMRDMLKEKNLDPVLRAQLKEKIKTLEKDKEVLK